MSTATVLFTTASLRLHYITLNMHVGGAIAPPPFAGARVGHGSSHKCKRSCLPEDQVGGNTLSRIEIPQQLQCLSWKRERRTSLLRSSPSSAAQISLRSLLYVRLAT